MKTVPEGEFSLLTTLCRHIDYSTGRLRIIEDLGVSEKEKAHMENLDIRNLNQNQTL